MLSYLHIPARSVRGDDYLTDLCCAAFCCQRWCHSSLPVMFKSDSDEPCTH